MKKFFLIPMLALFAVVNAWGNVAKIGNQEYETVQAAINAAANGDQIDLIANVVEQLITVPDGKSIIFNLNGHSLSTDFEDGDQSIDGNSAICNYGTLIIISEGNGMVSLPVGNEKGFPVVNHGELTIYGGLFIGALVGEEQGVPLQNPCVWTYGGNTTINGGTYVLAKGGIGCWAGIIGNTDEGTTIVNGGQFSANPNAKAKLLAEDCSLESVAFSNVLANWVSTVYWVKPAETVTIAENTPINEDREEEAMLIGSGATVTIAEGTVLTINDDISFKDATSKLVVEEGATLVVGDEIIAANFGNIELDMNAKDGNYSSLLVKAGQLQESHPKATVSFAAKCYKANLPGQKYVWQRFTVPSHLKFAYKDIVNTTGYETAIYGWDYNNNDWKRLGEGDSLFPFQCYDMTINSENQDAVYNFPCELVGNGNPKLQLREGWNYYANSYTAPLNLKTWLKALRGASYKDLVDATIYVQMLDNSWIDFSFADIITRPDELPIKQLEPMQVFTYRGKVAGNIQLDYDKFVYTPLFPAAGAPARHDEKSDFEELQYASFVVRDASGEQPHVETVWVYLDEAFADPDERNGFEVVKLINEDYFNMYFSNAAGDFARIAAEEIDGAAITFVSNNVTSYILSFENVELEGYALYDSFEQKKIEIKEGDEYSFTVEPNTTYADRFVIMPKGQIHPTSIENTEAAKKAKGIYTLTGQYMGNDMNVLPAGVYVVNGQKVVK